MSKQEKEGKEIPEAIRQKIKAKIRLISNASFYEPMMKSTFEYHLKTAGEFGYSLKSPDEKEGISDLGEVFEVDEVYRLYNKTFPDSTISSFIQFLLSNKIKFTKPLQQGEGAQPSGSANSDIFFYCAEDFTLPCRVQCQCCKDAEQQKKRSLEIVEHTITIMDHFYNLFIQMAYESEQSELTEKAAKRISDLKWLGTQLGADYPLSKEASGQQGVGKKEVSQMGAIGFVCEDKNCKYCGGTGRIPVLSPTDNRKLYAIHYSNGVMSNLIEVE